MENILREMEYVNRELQCEFDEECKLLATESRELVPGITDSIEYVCSACAHSIDEMLPAFRESFYKLRKFNQKLEKYLIDTEKTLEIYRTQYEQSIA